MFVPSVLSGFSPTSISGLVLWLDSTVGVYQDSAGTIPVTAGGQSVGLWKDQSGNGYNYSQSSSGLRPTYNTNKLGSFPAISTNGSSTYLSRSTSTALRLNGKTVYAVFQRSTGSSEGTLLDVGNCFAVTSSATGTSVSLNVYNQNKVSFSGYSNSTFGIVAINQSGATASVRSIVGFGATLGVSSSSFNDTIGTDDGSALGSVASVGTYGAYDIICLLYYSGPHTAAQQAKVQLWLLQKYFAYNYLWGCFSNNDSTEKLHMLYSADGVTWGEYPVSYAPPGTDSVRDVNLVQANGQYYAMHTAQGSTSGSPSGGSFKPSSYFDIASSPDLQNWTWLASVDCSAIVGSNTNSRTWGPKWVASDVNFGLHVVVALSTGGDSGPFAPYVVYPTNSSFTTWSTPVALRFAGSPGNTIDNVIRIVNGTWFQFYKIDDRVTQTNDLIEYATATVWNGTYTVQTTGNWAGWSYGVEGCSFLQLSNGNYQIYLDRYSAGTGYAYSYTTAFPSGAWSTLTGITAPFVARAGVPINANDVIVNPAPIAVYMRQWRPR